MTAPTTIDGTKMTDKIKYFLEAWEMNGVGQTVATVQDSPGTVVTITVDDLRALLSASKPAAPVVECADSPLTDFREGQWWINELDAWAKSGSDDQKRAVAVVHHLLRVAAAPAAPAQSREAVAWMNKSGSVMSALQKQTALNDGGAFAATASRFSIPLDVRDTAPQPSQPAQAGEAWIAHWAGSNPYKGWSIRCGREEIIWFGETVSSETVEGIVLAHNKCFDCEGTGCVMNCSGLRAETAQSAVVLDDERAAAREVIEPLTEPVYIKKALLGGRNAHVVRSGGEGPPFAVHLVNIGITGWVESSEWAEGYAKGFNQAAAWMQDAILARAASPQSTATHPAQTERALTDEQIGSITETYAKRWRSSGSWNVKRCIQNALIDARALLAAQPELGGDRG